MRLRRAGVVLLLATAAVPAEARVVARNAREFFGDAAFGLPQHYVAGATIALVLLLTTIAIGTQRNAPFELAFLVSVAGGLLSNPFGMILIMLASLVGTIAIGQVMTWMGFESKLTPEQEARVARTLRSTGLPQEDERGQ
jgi:hypothetical protein